MGATCKIINCLIFESYNSANAAYKVGGIWCGWDSAAKKLIYNCIVRGCSGRGMTIADIYGNERNAAVCCTIINNGLNGIYLYSFNARCVVWNCYAGNNAGGDYGKYSAATAVSGWNASKDASASGYGGDNYKNSLDLLTGGEIDADGLATEEGLYANGAAGDRYGRNPYDDLTAVEDWFDFLKNDTSGEAVSKKDICGTDRPTPDTADAGWNVGASEQVSSAVDYDAGTSSGGLVFGGQVTALGTVNAGISSGGLVFGGGSTAPDVNNVNAGLSSGGLVFGGDSYAAWQAEPNNLVAVKGATYRIGGTLYTLPETLSYQGLGSIAALVNCGTAPATAGLYRYDLLSIDAAGTITVTAGTEAATPVMPATPASEVKLDHVLRYYGQTSIVQADIGKLYLAPQLTILTAAVTDDELAWAETSTAITITCRDQYGQLYTGSKVVNASITTGNGTIAPASRSGAASSFSFAYTRGGNDPGDVSPLITFNSPIGPFCTAFIKLLDAAGNLMT